MFEKQSAVNNELGMNTATEKWSHGEFMNSQFGFSFVLDKFNIF